MAVVLLIVAILAGGLTAGIGAQIAQRNALATRDALDEAREALLGHLLRQGRFPCPARSAADGAEDRDGAGCRGGRRTGLVPWATLGIRGLDGWGRRLSYAVTPAYTQVLGAPPPGDIELVTRNLAGHEKPLTTGDGRAPVVLLSHGRNGLGAFDAEGFSLAPPPAGSDEATNTGDGRRFVSRGETDNPSAPGGAFDDQLMWLSPNVVAHRLAAAGRLP